MLSHPVASPWGRKAFTAYLGEAPQHWRDYDASLLMREATHGLPTLVDQGLDDSFLTEQLMPDQLELAAQQSGYPLTLRRHAGYDHSYYFIASFIDDHLRFHARHLGLMA